MTVQGIAPTITTHPANLTVTEGQGATFNVGASGTAPLSYQWERSNNGGSTWEEAGTGSSSYTIAVTALGDSGAQFRCTVSNGAGDAVSNVATLIVNQAPSILKGFWKFDEGTGTSVGDSSGNTNTGSVSGATWNSSGKVNGALVFNGTSNRVQIPNSPSLASATNAITVAAWVYPSSATGAYQTLMQRSSANGSWFDWQFYTRDTLTGNSPSFRVDWNRNSAVDAGEEVGGISFWRRIRGIS